MVECPLMRKLTAGLSIFLIIVFVAASAMSVNYLMQTREVFASGSEGRKALDYHAIVLLPDTGDSFFGAVADSIKKAAAQGRIGLELGALPYTQDMSAVRRGLDRSILSKPDGIVVFGSNDQDFVKLINQAEQDGVRVITVASDSPSSRRSVFVGSNNFGIGLSAGRTIRSARPDGARIGVILNQSDPAARDSGANLVLSGLAEAIKGSGAYKLSVVRASKPGVFSGEEIAVEILTQHPDVDVLFCTSAKDTLGAAQTIIDQNRVGQVLIIGFDDPVEILDYVDKGVIHATIVRNPQSIGRGVVDSFLALKDGRATSGFVDSGFEILTRNSPNFRELLRGAGNGS